jgi:hypothetical protein
VLLKIDFWKFHSFLFHNLFSEWKQSKTRRGRSPSGMDEGGSHKGHRT